MYISVMFKDKNKVFKGKTYDYLLADNEIPPKKDAIIRMYNATMTKPIAYAARVKVIDVKEKSDSGASEPITFIEASLDD